jgi:hypothetical protein
MSTPCTISQNLKQTDKNIQTTFSCEQTRRLLTSGLWISKGHTDCISVCISHKQAPPLYNQSQL